MATRLESVLVEAALSAQKYVAGAQAKADADERMRRSGEGVDQQTKRTEKAIEQSESAFRRFVGTIDGVARAQFRMEQAQARLNGALNTGKISQEEHARLMQRLQGQFEREAASAERAALAMGRFGGVASQVGVLLGGITAALGARQLIEYADTWTRVEGRIRLVTRSTDELTAVQGRLFAIAQQTRSSFESTVDLYTRVARNADELGLSQTKLLALTETVNKAIQVGGSGAQEAAAGVVQFGQALASGVLRGDEFRSIMENMPGLAQALARGLNVTVGQLRALANDGKLTAEVVTQALLKMSGSVDAEFKRLPMTFAQSLTVLENSFTKYVGELDKATGTTRAMADAVVFLGNNLETVIPIIAALGGAVAAARLAVLAMNGALLANPITAAISLFVALGGAVLLLAQNTSAAEKEANKHREAVNAFKTASDGYNDSLKTGNQLLIDRAKAERDAQRAGLEKNRTEQQGKLDAQFEKELPNIARIQQQLERAAQGFGRWTALQGQMQRIQAAAQPVAFAILDISAALGEFDVAAEQAGIITDRMASAIARARREFNTLKDPVKDAKDQLADLQRQAAAAAAGAGALRVEQNWQRARDEAKKWAESVEKENAGYKVSTELLIAKRDELAKIYGQMDAETKKVDDYKKKWEGAGKAGVAALKDIESALNKVEGTGAALRGRDITEAFGDAGPLLKHIRAVQEFEAVSGKAKNAQAVLAQATADFQQGLEGLNRALGEANQKLDEHTAELEFQNQIMRLEIDGTAEAEDQILALTKARAVANLEKQRDIELTKQLAAARELEAMAVGAGGNGLLPFSDLGGGGASLDMINRALDAVNAQIAKVKASYAGMITATETNEDLKHMKALRDEASGPMLEIFKNAARGIQEAMASAFKSMITGGKITFGNLKNLAADFLAQMMAMITYRPLVGAILGAAGASPQFIRDMGGMVFSSGQGGADSAWGGLAGVGSWIGSLFSGGSSGALASGAPATATNVLGDYGIAGAATKTGASAMPAAGGMFANFGIGSALGILGSALPGIMSRNGGQAITGAAGAALGTFFGPIGTMVGGAIGNIVGSMLFKKKPSVGPGQSADFLTYDDGSIEARSFAQDNKGSIKVAQQYGRDVVKAFDTLFEEIGAGAQFRGGTTFAVGSNQKEGFQYALFQPGGDKIGDEKGYQSMGEVVAGLFLDAFRNGLVEGLSDNFKTAFETAAPATTDELANVIQRVRQYEEAIKPVLAQFDPQGSGLAQQLKASADQFDALKKSAEDLGLAIEPLAQRAAEAAQAIRDGFVRDLEAAARAASGKGYINSLLGAVETASAYTSSNIAGFANDPAALAYNQGLINTVFEGGVGQALSGLSVDQLREVVAFFGDATSTTDTYIRNLANHLIVLGTAAQDAGEQIAETAEQMAARLLGVQAHINSIEDLRRSALRAGGVAVGRLSGREVIERSGALWNDGLGTAAGMVDATMSAIEGGAGFNALNSTLDQLQYSYAALGLTQEQAVSIAGTLTDAYLEQAGAAAEAAAATQQATDALNAAKKDLALGFEERLGGDPLATAMRGALGLSAGGDLGGAGAILSLLKQIQTATTRGTVEGLTSQIQDLIPGLSLTAEQMSSLGSVIFGVVDPALSRFEQTLTETGQAASAAADAAARINASLRREYLGLQPDSLEARQAVVEYDYEAAKAEALATEGVDMALFEQVWAMKRLAVLEEWNQRMADEQERAAAEQLRIAQEKAEAEKRAAEEAARAAEEAARKIADALRRAAETNDDLDVRLLRAQGLDQQAGELELIRKHAREMNEWREINQEAGQPAIDLAKAAMVQALELEKYRSGAANGGTTGQFAGGYDPQQYDRYFTLAASRYLIAANESWRDQDMYGNFRPIDRGTSNVLAFGPGGIPLPGQGGTPPGTVNDLRPLTSLTVSEWTAANDARDLLLESIVTNTAALAEIRDAVVDLASTPAQVDVPELLRELVRIGAQHVAETRKQGTDNRKYSGRGRRGDGDGVDGPVPRARATGINRRAS